MTFFKGYFCISLFYFIFLILKILYKFTKVYDIFINLAVKKKNINLLSTNHILVIPMARDHGGIVYVIYNVHEWKLLIFSRPIWVMTLAFDTWLIDIFNQSWSLYYTLELVRTLKYSR